MTRKMYIAFIGFIYEEITLILGDIRPMTPVGTNKMSDAGGWVFTPWQLKKE